MSGQSKFEEWALQRNFQLIAKELVQLERRRISFDLNTVVDDPGEGLADHPEVKVQYDSAPPVGCSVYGYYEFQPGGKSVIHVHPASTFARDNFTILHELGHHVQQHYREWLDVRHGVSGRIGDTWEERVADAFAGELLIPEQTFGSSTEHLSARALAAAHTNTSASRSAVAMRAMDLYAGSIATTVVVATSEGDVIFARSCGDDVFTPARGLSQPSIAPLISEALQNSGYAQGDMNLDARSGWSQQELKAEVALDSSGDYSFVVIRPARRFGDKVAWARREHHCSNAACDESFTVDEATPPCPRCDDPKCPHCQRCSCEPGLLYTCPECRMGYTVAEQSNPASHECF